MSLSSWVKSLFVKELDSADTIQNSTTHTAPTDIDSMLEILVGGVQESAAGISITPTIAMRQATVYSCVKILSDTVAQLPLLLYSKTKDGRDRAVNHPIYDLLKTKPNNYMTASEFKQFMTAAVVLRGIACAYKVMVGNKVKELLPIAPDSVEEVWNDNGTRDFNILFTNGKYETVPGHLVFCVKGLTLDGRTPVSPIKYMADSIGLSIAAKNHGSKFFKNGARPSGVLTSPNKLGPDKTIELRDSWEAQHSKEKVGKTAVLSGGLEYKVIAMSNEDSQLLELMGFSRTEICGIFGIPPHLVGAIEKTSSWGTGLAEQMLTFVKFTMGAWLKKIEESVDRDLLSISERRKYYVEFLTDQFLRGDTKSRYEAYKIGLGGQEVPAFLTVNEVRKRENLPPVSGGDTLYKPTTGEGTENNEKQI